MGKQDVIFKLFSESGARGEVTVSQKIGVVRKPLYYAHRIPPKEETKECSVDRRKRHLELSLFGLRLTIFFVMLIWTLDKFVNPGHAAKVYEKFYFISGMESMVLNCI